MLPEFAEQFGVRPGHALRRAAESEPRDQGAVGDVVDRDRQAASVRVQLAALAGQPLLATASQFRVQPVGVDDRAGRQLPEAAARQSACSASSSLPSAEACG